MKRIYFILALIVCQWTLAQSQILLNAPQARILIAKLDSLDYVRAGYAFQDSLLTVSEREVYNRQMAVEQRDSIIALQVRSINDQKTLTRKAESKISFWKYTSGGLAISTITAILIGIFK